jgi:Abortive infection C-terminus
MADITKIESLKLEKIFDMQGGYVLDFSNRTLNDFVLETINVELYADKYSDKGDSKANRIRTIWHKEHNYKVGTLIFKLLEYWRDKKTLLYKGITEPEQNLYDECIKICNKLIQNIIVEEIEVFRDNHADKDFSLLSKSIRESIEKNEPEVALDRLHTYVMKFIRKLCDNHSIVYNIEESLNAVFGKYVKFIITSGKIESQMTEKILKYSINVLESFNDIRNNKSLAHDNKILNYSESLLIFNNVTNSIKFIETIEHIIEADNKKIEEQKWEDLPF